jgi:peptidoglycan/xylan/chitin deacetylase (PgdA/CDA1 family)
MKLNYRKKEEGQSSPRAKNLRALLIFIEIILLISIGIILIKSYQIRVTVKPKLETPKTEEKTLPPEVKKKLTEAPYSETIRVPILMYHYVEYVKDTKDTFRQSMNIPPDVFDEQVKTLLGAGYNFITVRELGAMLDQKIPIPDKPIILTFDDGHWDLYTDVLPILRKYSIKATAYIIPGFLGGSDFLSQKQLQAIIDSRLIDIGAHTVNHMWLKGQSIDRVQREIGESKIMLETMYKIRIATFAYPFGAFDLQAEQVVKNDGFTAAVSTVPGVEQNQANRFFMYRLRPGRRTGEDLLKWLEQNTFNAFSATVIAHRD